MNDWIYDVTEDNKYRFTLGQPRLFTDGSKPDEKLNILICFGINPSTAEPDNLDNTLKSVVRITKNNGYDGWIMCNIYPQRATNPNDMDMQQNTEMHNRNMEAIINLLRQYPNADLWAAWGTLITKRDYLYKQLREIDCIAQQIFDRGWVTFGEISKEGHPHHPLYLRQDSEKIWFQNVDTYIESVERCMSKRRRRHEEMS